MTSDKKHPPPMHSVTVDDATAAELGLVPGPLGIPSRGSIPDRASWRHGCGQSNFYIPIAADKLFLDMYERRFGRGGWWGGDIFMYRRPASQ